jgi:NhaP-type Na+/H+ or K+/H+ antiporter
MTLALIALIAAGFLERLSRLGLLRQAASAPGLVLVAGASAALIGRVSGVPTLPTEWLADLGEALLAALVFAAAAQLRLSRLAALCPAAFRLSLGGAPLYLIVCALSAFILIPQLSPPAALLVAATLMLNGGAFDRKAVTQTHAPASIKAAVRIESAAIIALGAPIAAIAVGYATTPGAHEAPLKPLLDASFELFAGFAIGGALGLIAARRALADPARSPYFYAVIGGALAFIVTALLHFNAVIAAGACGLIWGEEIRTTSMARLRLRRRIEEVVQPAAYFLFAAAFAPRLFGADLLSMVFAIAAATVLRAGPRLAALQMSSLAPESQRFLAWFGGAPGAASALFLLSILDDAVITDHETVLSVSALAIIAGVAAARLTSRPLANGFLRQLATARKRRLLAG